jgi:hypothetical protein
MIELKESSHSWNKNGKKVHYRSHVWMSIGLLVAISLAQMWLKPFNQLLFVDINEYGIYVESGVWCVLTMLGDTSLLWPMLLPFMRPSPRTVFASILAIPVGGLLSVILKHLFNAPRPAELREVIDFNILGPVLTGNSFPSGHTITAFAAACAIVMTLELQNQKQQKAICWSVIVFASLIGLSRVMVGAHWPFDVMAGACVGWLGGVSGLKLAGRLEMYWQKRVVQKIAIGLLWSVSALNLFREFDYPQGMAATWISCALATWGLIFYCWPISHNSSVN